MVISFLSPLVSSNNVSLSSPSEVVTNEQFDVSLNINTQENYDVKIYVEDKNSGKTISQILNVDKWQSSYYYLKDAYPQNSVFSVKIIEAGKWEICLRLRNKTISSPLCNQIEVLSSSEQTESDEEEINNGLEGKQINEENKEDEHINEEQEDNSEIVKEAEEIQEFKQLSYTETNLTKNKIILNANKEDYTKTITTKTEKTKLFMSILFSIFSFFILILLILKKI